jgi:endoglucanase
MKKNRWSAFAVHVRSKLPWVVLLLVAVAPAHCRASAATEPSGFKVRRGTNISHWLSQSNRRGAERDAWFTRADVEFLAGLGFDHLRIPIDEEQMWDTTGRPEKEAFELLNHALDWCAEFRLNAIVDLHILRSHHFNSKERPLWTQPEAQERFVQCWRDLSNVLQKRPVSSVAYELMNEPVADNPDAWNKLVAKAVAVIRAKEPRRVIVIGSNRWQSVDTFDRLQVPENDPNILLSFHFYEPFLLTHYQASWTGIGKYTGPVSYPGRTVAESDVAALPEELKRQMGARSVEWNRQKIEEKFAKPLALAKQTGLPLYCGEWGCLHTVPRAARLAWYRDMVAVLSEKGISWATWDYKGGFGLRKPTGEPDQELINILLHR